MMNGRNQKRGKSDINVLWRQSRTRSTGNRNAVHVALAIKKTEYVDLAPGVIAKRAEARVSGF